MKTLGKTEKSNNSRIRFNFPFFFGGGGVRLSKSKYGFFSTSGTATLLSKYGNAALDSNNMSRISYTIQHRELVPHSFDSF